MLIRRPANAHATTVDGQFGPRTAAAVCAFQQQHHLAVAAVVGRHTWTVLLTGHDY